MFSDERRATSSHARQVLEILDQGWYRAPSGTTVSLIKEQSAAESGTCLYSPEHLHSLRERGDKPNAKPARIEVIDATTQVAAHELAQDSQLVLLNFASGLSPGGGFLVGAKAQEEELCRCSGLYRTLITQPAYYRANWENRSHLYTDHIIYSPSVPFFRTATEAPLLDADFLASVITAPAPNAAALPRDQPSAASGLPAIFRRRWANILAVAQYRMHETLLLGAWGCGAFGNDPWLVAQTAREALKSPRFAGVFSSVVFAIPSFNKHSRTNLEIFCSVLLD